MRAQATPAASSDFFTQVNALQQRMPALDGLRALAILSVLWHNSTAGQYRGNAFLNVINLLSNAGWLGVQLFFVLSGFLITGILLDSADTSRRFFNFYARRFLRIFPPYYTLLLVMCGLLPALFPQQPLLHEHLDRSIWYWFFLNNWTSPFIGEMPTLPHLWSLAVEEQFYIFWPACIFLLPRRMVPQLCAGAVMIALLTRFGLTLYDAEFAQEAAYKFTLARWDALTIGAALALLLRNAAAYPRLCRYRFRVLLCTGTYITVFATIYRNFSPTGPGLTPLNQTIAAIFFGCVIFYAIETKTGIAQRWQDFLKQPLLQAIGKYSYAMYLFHMPLILAFGPLWRTYCSNFAATFPAWSITAFAIVVLMATYCLAAISWMLIERPLLTLKRFFYSPAPN